MDENDTFYSSPHQDRKTKIEPKKRSTASQRPARLDFDDIKQEAPAERRTDSTEGPCDRYEGNSIKPSMRVQYSRSSLPVAASFWSGSRAESFHKLVSQVVTSKKFDIAIGIIIAVNSVSIGIEQDMRVRHQDTSVFVISEHVFLVIYITELGLRLFVFGMKAMTDHWVKFDSFLVALSILTQWILTPTLGSNNVESLGPVMVVRTARLARLARALRLLYMFRELWMLVRGLMVSAKNILYTFVMLTIILYMFATVAVELITLNHGGHGRSDEYDRLVHEYFSDLMLTMLTLVQFVCMDSIGQIYRPMIKENKFLACYFMALIIVVAVVLMNIVTAVLVNGAFEQASQDKEMVLAYEQANKDRQMKDLYLMFTRLDQDGSGCVDREEIQHASGEDRALLNEFMDLHDLMEVFNQLDIDGGGQLEIQEFCEGLYECSVSKTPIELKVLDKRVQALMGKQERALALAEEGCCENGLLKKLDQRTEAIEQQYHHLWSAIEKLRETVMARPMEMSSSASSVQEQSRALLFNQTDESKVTSSKQAEVVALHSVPLLIPDVMHEALSIPSRDDSSEGCFNEEPNLEERGEANSLMSKPLPADTPNWAREVVLEIRRLVTGKSLDCGSKLATVPRRSSHVARREKVNSASCVKAPVSWSVARPVRGRDSGARKPPIVVETEEQKAAVPPPRMSGFESACETQPTTSAEPASEPPCNATPPPPPPPPPSEISYPIARKPPIMYQDPCVPADRPVATVQSRVDSTYGDVGVEKPEMLTPSMPPPVLGL